MRSFISGLGGAGGAVAFAAFFLPWLSISCDDLPVVDVSAFERASGDISGHDTSDVEANHVDLGPQPKYWSLLALPFALITLTGALALAPAASARRLGLAIVGTALAGLVLITIFWLEQHLGLASPTRAPPGINIQLQNEIGGWLALGGHTCALISGTLAAILGSTWD